MCILKIIRWEFPFLYKKIKIVGNSNVFYPCDQIVLDFFWGSPIKHMVPMSYFLCVGHNFWNSSIPAKHPGCLCTHFVPVATPSLFPLFCHQINPNSCSAKSSSLHLVWCPPVVVKDPSIHQQASIAPPVCHQFLFIHFMLIYCSQKL